MSREVGLIPGNVFSCVIQYVSSNRDDKDYLNLSSKWKRSDLTKDPNEFIGTQDLIQFYSYSRFYGFCQSFHKGEGRGLCY